MIRRLLLILLLASPCFATWTLTQVKDNNGCSTTTCAVTVTSTGSSHLLVAGLISTNASITISSVSVGACTSAWTHAANSNNSPSVDLYYCTNSASGQTSITITSSGTMGGSSVGVIWEASSSLGTIAIDSGATPSQHVSDTTCTACAGTSLTLSGNNDFIAALANCGGTCSNVTGTGWTNDLANPNGDGVAHGITSGSQTSPATWTMTSSTLSGDAAAFQETSSAVGPNVGFKGKVGVTGKVGIL